MRQNSGSENHQPTQKNAASPAGTPAKAGGCGRCRDGSGSCRSTTGAPSGTSESTRQAHATPAPHVATGPAHASDVHTDETHEGVLDRRSGIDRRLWGKDQVGNAGEGTGLERRRGPGRRRTDFTRSAEEGEMTQEQFLFISAIETFKRANNKMFPTWTDVLEVVRLLGYRKTQHSELKLGNCEDWTEKSDTPSGVREKPGHRSEQRPGDRQAA